MRGQGARVPVPTGGHLPAGRHLTATRHRGAAPGIGVEAFEDFRRWAGLKSGAA